MTAPPELAVDVRDFSALLDGRGGMRPVLDKINLKIKSGGAFALLGESGSGKTCFVHSILGLHPGAPGVIAGSAAILGRDMLPDLDAYVKVLDGGRRVLKDMHGWNKAMRLNWKELLGSEVTLVSQDAATSLSPFHNVGTLLTVALLRGDPTLDKRDALALGREWLSRVKMYDVDKVMTRHVGELSGGMAQRTAIALAMAPRPKLLIADEPTTGLDATLRIELLILMHKMVKEQGTTLFLVTHDIGAARLLAEEVGVLYNGMIVETGPVEKVLGRSGSRRHPYTAFLLDAEERLLNGREIPRPQRRQVAPDACPYAVSCARADAQCLKVRPPLAELGYGHQLACFHQDGP